MPEKEYEYLEKSLPGFTQARVLIKDSGDSVQPLGFVGTKYDFYRFANRFRLAASFQRMELEGFGEETSAGYDALTRVFFTWSAFEGYAELVRDLPPFRILFGQYPKRHIRELAARCRELDPENKLGAFLIEHSLKQIHMDFLEHFRNGNDFAVLTHAACIRHIFAHGRLTAHPNGLPAENLTSICNFLSSFLLDFMRSDFDRRLKLGKALATTSPSP